MIIAMMVRPSPDRLPFVFDVFAREQRESNGGPARCEIAIVGVECREAGSKRFTQVASKK
jgi:hypothetical protein